MLYNIGGLVPSNPAGGHMPHHEPMFPSDFQSRTQCSDATLKDLLLYAGLLEKWQPRINLVGPKTLPDLWRRHILDSAQLFPLCGLPGVILDLGSGAGFPGLVLSLMGAGSVHLVESDQRKAVFLREVIRETGTDAVVHANRIERLAPFPVDVVTSRALAPLGQLLDFATPFLKKSTVCLFLKGKNVQTELTESQKTWNMAVNRIPSVTDPSGVVLKIEGISRHGVDQS